MHLQYLKRCNLHRLYVPSSSNISLVIGYLSTKKHFSDISNKDIWISKCTWISQCIKLNTISDEFNKNVENVDHCIDLCKTIHSKELSDIVSTHEWYRVYTKTILKNKISNIVLILMFVISIFVNFSTSITLYVILLFLFCFNCICREDQTILLINL